MVSHPVALRAPALLGGGEGPVLLQRLDARFMSAVRDELGDRARWPELAGTVAATRVEGALRLYQPTHRTFHLAVLDARCDITGHPRLQREKIESAGLVIRRVVRRRGNRVEQAWMHAEDGLRGWIDTPGDPERAADPDPARRPQRSSGHPALDAQLARFRVAGPALAETVSPLFVLPPAVCERAEATLIYGLVPTASLDLQKAPPAPRLSSAELLAGEFPDLLRAGRAARSIPLAGEQLNRARAADERLASYILFLQQVTVVYDLLGAGEGARRLGQALAEIRLPLAGGERSVTAREHVERAARVLLFGDPGTVEMPERWPVISAELEARLVAAASEALGQRFDQLGREIGRFADDDARYVARAFVRVRRPDGCPPELVWSRPSQEFSIAPWYETGPGATPIISLPDPRREGLSKLKPNVAFQVPSSVADMLRGNTPASLLKGEGKPGAGLGIRWLCSFNIPIITLCAFIVLSIFLSLLNIIFWWLPFVKICFPLPAPSAAPSDEQEGGS